MPRMPESFHPIIQTWFTETYGEPTAVQAQAWPLIEEGENVLALAPTGSGKTLTAFLSAISRFCKSASGSEPEFPADRLTVLYVSPLKALNEDIRRNLLEPLAAIDLRFGNAGLPFPAIRVETRSGDTPQSQRRRFLSHPPSILALTPESLAILLLSPKGRQALSSVKYLILDEIHAVLGNKRGSFLSCQIDRLALLCGEFQRISLSATIRPPEAAADFVGGIDSNGRNRKVRIVAPESEKLIELSIEYPKNDDVNDSSQIEIYGKRYTSLIKYILNKISKYSTLLVFTDSRRRAERLCYYINREAALQEAALQEVQQGQDNSGTRCLSGAVAFPHHGSLARELRQSVEQRLASGELPCVVATASLELGIDIGNVDEVILAGSPGIVSQALQRIGRAGHSVGRISRGKLFPFHGMDLLLAVALKGAVDERDIEEVHPIENPLDILAQIILALCVEKTRNIDELYLLLKGFYIFRNLNRESYNRTVYMMAGMNGKERQREIKPRIWMDTVTNEVGALDGSLLLLYSSGGVIANRGLYSLRLPDGTKIGEVDEEFVWERRLGDCFHFGGRNWRVTGIGAEAMEIKPLESPADFIPFWHSDTYFRSDRLTERVLMLLDDFNSGKSEASTALFTFLNSQREAQGGAALAGSSRITVEIIDSPENSPYAYGGQMDIHTVVIHCFRGGAVNYPLALALAQELEEKLEMRVETFSNDDSILFLIPRLDTPAEKLILSVFMSLNKSGGGGLSRGERLFRNRLEISGVFGANFREAAERSLLLPKAGFGKRTPLWITRQRSKRLFDSVALGSDKTANGFPVTAEAWRSCLQDMFDMEGFRELLASINDGSLTISFFRSSLPSPFSQDMVRQETNTLIYEYDERRDVCSGTSDHSASLSDRVIREALGDSALRPALKQDLVERFTMRLRREISGWAPDDELSLCEWVKERIVIPLDEWETLLAALPEELRQELPANSYINDRIKIMQRNGAAMASVVHREWESTWNAQSTSECLSILGPWLRYEGPITLLRITEVFGVSPAEAEDAVNALIEVEELVPDIKIETSTSSQASPSSPNSSLFYCDRENLEMLLRLSRKKARPEIAERSAAVLVPFLALRQGLAGTQAAILDNNDSKDSASNDPSFLKKLAACSAPAKLWETEFCTSRCAHYSPDIIDREIREGRLIWYGTGMEKIGLCAIEDIDLVQAEGKQSNTPLSPMIQSGFFDRPRDFWEIKEAFINEQKSKNKPADAVNANSKNCAETLWKEVWKGMLSADSFEPVRRGMEYGFIPKDIEIPEQNNGMANPFTGRRTAIPRALRDRWKGGAPVRGLWFSIAVDKTEQDSFDEENRNRDRVRLLLARWGILCRPLLERESAQLKQCAQLKQQQLKHPFSWSELLPTIRRMELSGELCAGRFFAGINSLQFASPAIAKELETAESFDGIYWMNAADPASPAGIEIENLDPNIPARQPSSRLYFRGSNLIAVTNKNGKDTRFFIDCDDSGIAPLIELFKIPRKRKVFPEHKINVETINNEEAARSKYAAAFQSAGFVSDRGRLYYW